MKKLLLLTLICCALSAGAWAQSGAAGVVTVSGTALPNIPNPYGVLHVSFEEIPTGAPATVSVPIVGCMRSGTCDAAADTNVATTATIRYVTFTKVYDYFVVTPSWTGGTNPTYKVNYTMGAN